MVMHSFILFPSEFVEIANGMIYGPFGGGGITWIGAMLGSSVALGLAKRFGRPFVYRLLNNSQQDRLEQWIHYYGGYGR